MRGLRGSGIASERFGCIPGWVQSDVGEAVWVFVVAKSVLEGSPVRIGPPCMEIHAAGHIDPAFHPVAVVFDRESHLVGHNLAPVITQKTLPTAVHDVLPNSGALDAASCPALVQG